MNLTQLQRRASLRYLFRQRAQSALAVTGIALGVAMVIAISLTQHSARVEFSRALEGLFGTSTHRVVQRNGSVNIATLARLRQLAPNWHPRPVVEAAVTVAANGRNMPLMLYGIDPLSTDGTPAEPGFDMTRFVREPGLALLDHRVIEKLGLHRGEQFSVHYGSAQRPVNLLDDIDSIRRTNSPSQYVVVDIGTAHSITESTGFSYLELTIDETAANLQIAELKRELGEDVEIVSHGRNLNSARQLTQAFNTNLKALALLSLVVGSFMVYNTLGYLVAQRQPLFARMRALGVERSTLALQVLYEAWILAILGTIVGSFAGIALTKLLIGPLSVTMGDHYFAASGTAIELEPGRFAIAFLLTLMVATIAAAAPALQAARTMPATQMQFSEHQRELRKAAAISALIGAICMLSGCAVLWLSSRSLAWGFVGLGLFVVGAMLATPSVVLSALGAIPARLSRLLPYPVRLGIRQSQEAAPILSAAIAAVVGAVATSIGIGLMVASFRLSVVDWLDQLLRADAYISGTLQTAPTLKSDDAIRLLKDPRIADISKVRRLRAAIDDTDIAVTAYALPPPARAGFEFLQTPAAAIWSQWEQPDSVLVSEPFAWHHQVAAGDQMNLTTPTGIQRVRIIGIYRDYGNERGVVAISWKNYQRYWHADRAHGFGLYVTDNADLENLLSDVSKMISLAPNTRVWSNAAVKQESLAVFDRTFFITDATTLLATIIAALAVFNALLTLNLEQNREHAILNALGIARGQMRTMLYCQNTVVVLFAVILAAPIGTALSFLLIDIINVRSFGWSMGFSFSLPSYLTPMGIALGFAALAMWYPVQSALRTLPGPALNDD